MPSYHEAAQHARLRPALSHRSRRTGLPAAAATLAGILAVGGTSHAEEAVHQWPQAQVHAAAPIQPTDGAGSLQIHATRAALLTAAGTLPLVEEDFSAGFSSSLAVEVCYQAVGHRSDDPCFAPGDLAPGFAIRSSRGNIFDANQMDSDIVVLGAGVIGTPGKVIGANIPDPPWNPTHISFDPPRTIIGMDVYDGMQAGTVRVTAYEPDETFIGSFDVQPPLINSAAFAGFTSTRPVGRVEINALANGGAELIGELLFGGTEGRLVATPDVLDFGSVGVGTTATQSVTLDNDGQLAMVVGDIPAAPAGFTLSFDGCSGSMLQPGDDCQLDYDFSPPHTGIFDAPATAAAGVDLALHGVGVESWVVTTPGHLQLQAPTGSTASAPVQLQNPGGAIQRVSSLPTSHPAFVVATGDCGSLPFELGAGAQCTLQVSFAPATAGPVDALLDVRSTNGSLGRVTLAGDATSAAAGGH